MSNARAGRGRGNNNLTAYQNSKVWDNLKPAKEGGCKHNRIVFKSTGKECRECGEVLS